MHQRFVPVPMTPLCRGTWKIQDAGRRPLPLRCGRQMARRPAFQRSLIPPRSFCLSVSGGRLRLRRRIRIRSLPRRVAGTRAGCRNPR